MARLDRARQAFRNGEYGQLRPLLEPTLEPKPRYEREEARFEARALLGAGAFFEAQAAREASQRDALQRMAKAQFLALLRERPDHVLDPLIYPISVLDMFEQVREEHREELERLRRDPKLAADPGLETIYIERMVRKRSYALNFAPFGVGQFQNGQPIKGTLFAAGQGVALAINVTSYFVILGLRGSSSGDTFYGTGDDGVSGDYALALGWRQAMLISLGVFTALYGWSVADALWHYEPEQVLQLRTLDRPPPELQPQQRLPPMGGMMLDWRWRF